MAGSSYATASRRKILEYLKNSNDHTVTAADVDEYLKAETASIFSLASALVSPAASRQSW